MRIVSLDVPSARNRILKVDESLDVIWMKHSVTRIPRSVEMSNSVFLSWLGMIVDLI